MKKIFACIVLLFAIAVMSFAVDPNYLRTTVYGVDGNGSNVVSTTYSDGLGREIQSKVSITGTTDRTVSTFYDEAGRKSIVTKPYIDGNAGSFYSGSLSEVKTKLKNEYISKGYTSDDATYAYYETQYYEDPTNRVKKTGAPGECHITSGKEVTTWNFGVTKSEITIDNLVKGKVSFKNGFIDGITMNTGYSTSDVLDELDNHLLSTETNEFVSPEYFLTVTLDQNQHLSQELSDVFGRTVAKRSDPTSNKLDAIISECTYDILGNLSEEIAPKDYKTDPNGASLISNTRYIHNILGQLIQKETPDGIIEKYMYNNDGTLYVKKYYYVDYDGHQYWEYQFAYEYDSFSRMTKTILCKSRPSVIIRNYYDDINILADSVDIYNIPDGTLEKITNTRGRLVASVCYNNINGKINCVTDLYSYDDDGNVIKKFKIVPGIPMQEVNYAYDIHGKKIYMGMECGNDAETKYYPYDNLGRLAAIHHTDSRSVDFVKYEYDEYGNLINKKLQTNLNPEYTYGYDIQNRLKDILISGNKGFDQLIGYDPSGNVIHTDVCYKNGSEMWTAYDYMYDSTSRLLYLLDDRHYASGYTYDPVGRFITKQEGYGNDLLNYSYHQSNNRLKSVKSGNDSYIYDFNGNLIVDKKKRMVIEYDWRNLPINFRFYSSIPNTVGFDDHGNVKINDPDKPKYPHSAIYSYMAEKSTNNPDCMLLSTTTMLYDADGNRVLKLESAQ